MTRPPARLSGSVYSAQWETDVLLSDGAAAHIRPIRPIRPDDAGKLRAFCSRLSSQTLYYRFFTPHVTLSDRDVEHFTAVDQTTRGALVALIGEDLVGIAWWERRPGEPIAEVAFLVEDAQQGCGIGSVLLEHLASAARERGCAGSRRRCSRRTGTRSASSSTPGTASSGSSKVER